MLIFFFTQERLVCELIAESLFNKGYRVFVFSDFKTMAGEFSDLQEKGSFPSLIALDFRVFSLKDPMLNLFLNGSGVPYIFYNNPYCCKNNFKDVWCEGIKDNMAKNGFIDKGGPVLEESLIRLLSDLEEIISGEDVLPYVSLVCPPKNIFETRKEMFDPYSFKRRHSLTPLKFKLLMHFFNNKGLSLSEKDLCLFMWNEYSPQKISTLYSYICVLRKALQKETLVCARIEREEPRCYSFTLSSC